MQVHAAIAAFTIPEMALEEEEAQVLARALAEVEKHYPISPLSEKHMAILGLGMAVVRVYGKRVPAVMGSAGKSKAPDAAPGSSFVPAVVSEQPPQDWFAQTGAAPDTHIQ